MKKIILIIILLSIIGGRGMAQQDSVLTIKLDVDGISRIQFEEAPQGALHFGTPNFDYHKKITIHKAEPIEGNPWILVFSILIGFLFSLSIFLLLVTKNLNRRIKNNDQRHDAMDFDVRTDIQPFLRRFKKDIEDQILVLQMRMAPRGLPSISDLKKGDQILIREKKKETEKKNKNKIQRILIDHATDRSIAYKDMGSLWHSITSPTIVERFEFVERFEMIEWILKK